LRLLRTKFASSPTSKGSPNLWSYAGMGVKQSGDRLFQLNNLKRKIVDELFFDLIEFFPTPIF
ncbi:hypothetical protein, partial [Streptococcus suis]|uniref:hypothetical protein n=1 Tax=Streptococcus suis TaxID=1307 RepID=UPI001C558825